jgi:lipoate-protein ligase A
MWRLLDHGPGSPRWNMAVDTVLLRSHAEAGGPPTLRLYQWSQPTLSLGAGQKLPAQLSPERLLSLGLAVVRRPTGGRAVLHGGDLTYCVVAGDRDGFQPSVTAVYRRLCQGLQAGLARLGIITSPGAPRRSHAQGFNCFALAASGDLTWQGKKCVGSAQTWQSHSYLQHGAILLTSQQGMWQQILGTTETAAATLEISLTEMLAVPLSLRMLKTALLQGFQEELGVTFEVGEFTAWEKNLLSGDTVWQFE